MILSSIITFLGGSAFRMVWGELSSAWTKRQERKAEIEILREQERIEAARFERQQQAIKDQHALGIEVIRVKAEADAGLKELDIWGEGIRAGNQPSGVWLIDAWNAAIRPATATICLWLWVNALWVQQWTMQGRDWEMLCGVLGWFFADRSMAKRGK
jgi:hypothetical protein